MESSHTGQLEWLRPLTGLMTPFYLHGMGENRHESMGSIETTRIIDFDAPNVQALIARAREGLEDPLEVLERAHGIIRDEVHPVYALNEQQPISRTLARGVGSCSQRLALLEGVARQLRIRTRVRALLVDRSFWYPRFPAIGGMLPDQMRLAWPEFRVDNMWRGASELFGSIGCQTGGGFKNHGSETLFEAVGRCAVDWDGKAKDDEYDLSAFIREDLGYFDSRDALFAELGETLNPMAKLVLGPVLSRVRA
jgi:hypothetical protein